MSHPQSFGQELTNIFVHVACTHLLVPSTVLHLTSKPEIGHNVLEQDVEVPTHTGFTTNNVLPSRFPPVGRQHAANRVSSYHISTLAAPQRAISQLGVKCQWLTRAFPRGPCRNISQTCRVGNCFFSCIWEEKWRTGRPCTSTTGTEQAGVSCQLRGPWAIDILQKA